ncbi:hypothetical protein AA98_0213 [Escherichia coli 2-011-08_S1_C1]|nr:hypothetical protein AA98_0213 [Escherichia coli 2-011-08_S1_C1]
MARIYNVWPFFKSYSFYFLSEKILASPKRRKPESLLIRAF